MPGESADVVRASIAAFNRRDLDTLLAMWDDDIEYDVTEVLLTGPHRGKDAVASLLQGLWDLLEEMWMEAERIEEVGDEELVVVVHQGGRGHGSGVEVEARRGHVMKLRRGKIWRVKVYADPAVALASAGLRE
ncbi:MAG: nuclear transport factor 2 family protein [Actinomycetota bacterium]|nr:nuclear transport factor 2 family protein [Actinomycetota bacterium]